MPTKAHYFSITDELRHVVATLVAAGLTSNFICARHPISISGIRAIKNEAGWQELLESKQIALTKLMGGRA